MTPNEPEVNVPLLRKAVEFVEASAALHGERVLDTGYAKTDLGTVWNQDDWSTLVNEELAVELIGKRGTVNLETCGTAYCVAGYVTSLQPGYQAEIRLNADAEPRLYETLNGREFYHSEVARKALGLTLDQADILFSGGNTAQDVRRLAEFFAGEPL